MITLDMRTLDIVFAVVEILTLAWGIREYLSHRDFKNKVVGWQAGVNGIAHACTDLEKDCEGDKVSSVKAAGEAVKMIALIAHPLDASMKAALKMSEETKR